MRLAPIMQAFFTDYLMTQRHASRHTIASYRDCLRLLLTFARQRTRKLPAQLDLADLDAVLIGTFLTELESTRGNSTAMALIHAGIDPTVIALWMGHASVASTKPYIRADMTLKQQAADRLTPPGVKPGRYQAPDELLADL